MAAVRTMMSAVREEAAVLTSEMAVAARSGGLEVVERNIIMEMNPVAVRQAAEASIKEVIAGEPSLLSQHLSHIPTQSTTTTTTSTISTTLNSISGATSSSTRTLVTQTLEADAGVTLKEVMSNALQTGVEEQMDEVAEIAKTLVEGKGPMGGLLNEGIQASAA
ncbi:hypothetical protein V865_003206 [Kwoniella europaea PYCC6329]|uniref:SMP domain-containing protein n=1 Tax=Kwoniella europaea PYCC6329 TaxID=1423913 RepID=A0AAX4KGF8_9TREE